MREAAVADLVVIGSHCAGLDVIASALAREGLRVKVLAVGSPAGLAAARRGECDVAPDPPARPGDAARYNAPFLDAVAASAARLRPRAGRGDARATSRATSRSCSPTRALRMVNRNRGSGTRVLIDGLLGERRPPGFAYEPRSHYAVAAAVAQRRADWGVTIETVAQRAGLRFRPLGPEHYDFAVPDRPLGAPRGAGASARSRAGERGAGAARAAGLSGAG